MSKSWSREDVLGLARSFQPASVIAAGVDWDLFTVLTSKPMTAGAAAEALGADLRAMTVLLDALVALELLSKQRDQYGVPGDVAELLTKSGRRSTLPLVQHQANCLRRWAQLSRVIKTGGPAERSPSVRGDEADKAAFVGAMDNVSGPIADSLVAEILPGRFSRLLDVGGASGTWTVAFLRAMPGAMATVFDLPEVIPMAHTRICEAGLSDRVHLVAGDFYVDDLPGGSDVVWLSAIAHQNSRQQNRELFGKIRRALPEEGLLLLRDVVMDESHTRPAGGAMFAVNMLVATEGGGTYALSEYEEDLHEAGFKQVTLIRKDPWMDSIIRAARA